MTSCLSTLETTLTSITPIIAVYGAVLTDQAASTLPCLLISRLLLRKG